MAGFAVRCPKCRGECDVPNTANGVDPGPNEPNQDAEVVQVGESGETLLAIESGASVSEQWYFRVPEGLQYGPIASSAMNQWVGEGRVDSTCQIREENTSFWRAADQFFPAVDRPVVATARTSSKSQHGLSFEGQDPVAESRGTMTLILTLLAWLTLCPVFSMWAWGIAATDLSFIRQGEMVADSRGWTVSAVRLARLHIILLVVGGLVSLAIGLMWWGFLK